VPTDARRDELKHFLRSRRERLSPKDFGFAEGTRRRTPGLRRDEVALLANIGTTTYTFLEQGRDINVSSHVLDRLAAVLRLSSEEKRHLYRLAIGDLPRLAPSPESLSSSLQSTLDYLGPCPSLILNYKFDLMAFNRAAMVVFKYPPDAAEKGYNIMTSLVLDQERQKLWVDLEFYMTNLVAFFRLNYARYTDDPEMLGLVRSLEEKSEDFRRWWSLYELLDVEDLLKPIRLKHSDLGELEGHFNLFTIFGYRDLTASVFTPIPGTGTAEKISRAIASNVVSAL
jgi:PAS domain-containing protein